MPKSISSNHGCPFSQRLSFETWVRPSRRCDAVQRALAWLEDPAQRWLGVAGPPVSGKTHFVHALGAHASTKWPELRVTLRTFEYLLNCPSSMMNEFMASELVLIDDVHKRSASLSSDFTRAFDGSPRVVFTTLEEDCFPSQLRQKLEQQSGCWIHLQRPTLSARLGIARSKCELLGHFLSAEQLELIVREAKNPRQIEGCVIRSARAHRCQTGRPSDGGAPHPGVDTR